MVKINTLGMLNGEGAMIKSQMTGQTQFAVFLVNNSGAPRLVFAYYTTAPLLAVFPSSQSVDIETGKWYQIEYIYKHNTAQGASAKVWNETGDTQIGSTQVSGTTWSSPLNIATARIGHMHFTALFSAPSTTDNVILFNRDTIWDDYAFPGPIVTAGHPTALRNSNVPFVATKQWRNNFATISRS
jgi:hypothetical protein